MDKVGKVMREFKEGKLKSSSGQKVTNPKQAIAIGISEQKAMKGYKAGGEPKAMVKKEVAFMKAKGAPKSMVKHEMAEMKGMKKYQSGGSVTDSSGRKVKDSSGQPVRTTDYSISRVTETGIKGGGGKAGGIVPQGLKPMKMGAVKTAAPSKDGVAMKGKTKGKMVKMAKGGYSC
jgi:hypothetical protein